MASSSSSSPPSSSTPYWKFDVFPSFHGADVRRSFLSHIFKEFSRKGINIFIDNEISRGRGTSIHSELISAIRGSKIAIVMLSRNYASSSWCLSELVEIMKYRETLGQTVVTVFYEIDPTDVRKQTGDFGKLFRKACAGKTREDIGRWRQALADVATIAGYHTSNWNDEATLIEHVAIDISNRLINSTPSRDFDGFVGMTAHMENLERMLCPHSDEVRMIGILGPPGVGKTTIARYLFNQIYNSFQLSAFMDNIKSRYTPPYLDRYSAQLQLQQDFLSEMINQKGIRIPHLGVLQERLKDRKVLAVLDDVDSLDQLDALAKETTWFGHGSRIIIVTEEPRLLKAHGIQHIYKVDLPTPDEALQILCMYAFGQKSPCDGFENLAQEAATLSGKLPRRLKETGSALRGMSKQEWKNALPRLVTFLDREQRSSEGLAEMEAHVEKSEPMLSLDSDEAIMVEEIFSDISDRLSDTAPSDDLNSLVGTEDHMENMKPMLCLESDEVRMIGIVGPYGIGKSTIAKFLYQQLSNRFQWSTIMANMKEFNASTCYNEPNTKLQLHNQLLSQLRNQNDTDRIFHLGAANEMLKDKKVLIVLDDVEGLGQLDAFVKETQSFGPGSRIIFTAPDEGLLKAHGIDHIYKVDLPSPDEAHQIFCMYAFGQKSPCDDFVNLAQEVATLSGKLPLGLKLMGTYLQDKSKHEWTNELPRLRTSLDGGLRGIAKFGYDSLCGEIALEGISNGILRWEWCPMTCWPSKLHPESLVELYMPHSKLEKLWEGIRSLINLRLMDLSSSKNLKELPDLSTAINLKILNLRCCSSMVELPYSIGYATSLLVLTLEYCTSLVDLPSSIGNITNLKELYLTGCSSLVELPYSIGNATNLQKLCLRCCSSLVGLPSSIVNAINIKELYLTGCSSLVELPASIGNATNLQKLNLQCCSSLVKLPYSIGNAINLKELYLIGCSSLVELPSSIGNATSLQKLNLECCSSLVKLPSSIGNAINLKELYLIGCSSLVELPSSIGNATNLEILDLSNCSSMVDLPSSIGNVNSLHYLYLRNCSGLVLLPSSIGNATNLWELDLNNCSSLVELPSSIGKASRLRKLDLSNCSSLVELPSSIGNATKLEILNLSNCSSLQKLPSSIGYATNLQYLYLNNCSNLMEVPYSIGTAINLKELDLSWCTSLVKLPASIMNSTSLWKLDIDNCSSLLEVPTGVRLKKLDINW